MNNKVHIFYFASTHWDREWYQSFQRFRYRLVDMFDHLIELFEKDPDYKVFHTDGQTVVLDDYAKVAEKENILKLKELIKEKKVLVGPWYVMPDEFLPSGESLIRNLMKGNRVAKRWGTDTWKYGYINDIFGHIAQMPQIFNNFNIKYALLGRGTNENDPVFFRWQAPNGDECFSFRLEPEFGYGKFTNIKDFDGGKSTNNPDIVERIKEEVDGELKRAKGIPIVILMDAGDHTEASKYATEYIKLIKELYPDAVVHHENLCEQGKLLESYFDKLPVIKGELNKTAIYRHAYLNLITHTLSSHYPLKKENDECQSLLEKEIEPIYVSAMIDGIYLNHNFVDEAYEYLLKNQPHDSICGCSIDRVHLDMKCRFAQVKEICNTIKENFIHKTEDRDGVATGDQEHLLTIYNPSLYDIERTERIELEFAPGYPYVYGEKIGYEDINAFRIFDADGNEISYQVVEVKRNMRVRNWNNSTTKLKDIHAVTFKVSVPAMSKAEYRIVPSETPVRFFKRMKSGLNYVENDYLRVDILSNGSLKLYDKKNNKVYNNLGNLVDDAEIGDGWNHIAPISGSVINSFGLSCDIEKIEDGPDRCVFKITRYLNLPEETVKTAYGRERSSKYLSLKTEMYVCLSEDSKFVQIKMKVFNNIKDHRLRIEFESGIKSDEYFAGQAFYCCKRKVGRAINTQDYGEAEKFEKATNGIVGKRDKDGFGLALVSKYGIHECFTFDDENGTFGVTLLRSFRRTITLENSTAGQINETLEYAFNLVPLDSDLAYSDLIKNQESSAAHIYNTLRPVNRDNKISKFKSKIKVLGKDVLTSVIKPAEEDKNAIIIRVYNASDEDTGGQICSIKEIKSASQTNLNEEDVKNTCGISKKL